MLEARHRPLFEAVFSAYTRRALQRAFHSVWLRGELEPAEGAELLCVQHVSWWDPLVLFHLTREHLPRRRTYAMMDEGNLRRFRFFTWIGAYGVERGSPAGAVAGVRYSLEKLAEPGARVLVFPQGRQRPMELRPLGLERGVGWLAARTGARVVPVALRYEFLEERWPDLFVSVGAPRTVERAHRRDAEERVERWLTEEADELRAAVHGGRSRELRRILRGRGPRDPWPEAREGGG